MQEQTQHKTGTQQAAGFSDADKHMGSATKTLLAPGLYPGLSAPQQLQEMANKSKKVAQLKETQQSINTNNQAAEALKVVQAMFVNKKDGKQISTLQDLNTELATLNSLQPFTNLTLADFPSAQSQADLDNAIAHCQTVVKDGINVQAQIIGFVEGIITSMSQSTNGTGSTTTRAGSGAAAAAAAATNATQSTTSQFVYNDPTTWRIVAIEPLPHIPRFETLGLSESDLADLNGGKLRGQHSGVAFSVNVPYHHHAENGDGGIAFIYLHEKGTNNVTLKIYDYTNERPTGSNQYEWKKGGRNGGPPPFKG